MSGISIENPFDTLEIDLIRYDPEHLYTALFRITNGLMDKYSQMGLVKTKIRKIDKKHPDYVKLASEKDMVEVEIYALEMKHRTVNSVIYGKSSEMRVFKNVPTGPVKH